MTGVWIRRCVPALLLVVAAAIPGRVQAKTVEVFSIKGAQNAIVVPDNWNGDLFLYAHGYSADKRILAPLPPDLVGVDTLLIPGLSFVPPGSAAAVTTFRSVGWYLKDAVKDIENLRRYFVKKYGKPKHTYIWGHSGGGLVTEAVIETFPRRYDGAAPMCGPGAGGWRNFNAAFDLRAVYEYVCRDVPDARFVCRVCSDGQSRCLTDAHCPAGQTCGATETPPSPDEGLTAECTEFLLEHPETFSENATAPGGDFVAAAVTPCFGDLNGGAVSPEQAARKDLFLRATQTQESFVLSDMFFASIGMAEVFHRRTKGKRPWGNEGIDYASPLLTADEQAAVNAGVQRVAADKAGVRFMRRFFEPRGRTRAKVVTVHALDDGLVIPENASKYGEAFAAARNADRLVQLFSPTGGHCIFINAWRPALQGLTAWVNEGTKPTTASVSAACGGCLTEMTPGPWGLRVVERKAKGVALRSLVCDGQPGDCPAEAMCVAARHRCK
jgi:pimeloyl-ACP methyl ester carboxylesterase